MEDNSNCTTLLLFSDLSFFFQKRLCIKGLMSDSKIVSSQENAKDKITQYACLLK